MNIIVLLTAGRITLTHCAEGVRPVIAVDEFAVRVSDDLSGLSSADLVRVYNVASGPDVAAVKKFENKREAVRRTMDRLEAAWMAARDAGTLTNAEPKEVDMPPKNNDTKIAKPVKEPKAKAEKKAAAPKPPKAERAPKVKVVKAPKVAKEPKAPKPPREARPKAEKKAAGPSKGDEVLRLVSRKSGADVKDIEAATGWLPHTLRAYVSGLRKKGTNIQIGKRTDGTRFYSVAAA